MEVMVNLTRSTLMYLAAFSLLFGTSVASAEKAVPTGHDVSNHTQAILEYAPPLHASTGVGRYTARLADEGLRNAHVSMGHFRPTAVALDRG